MRDDIRELQEGLRETEMACIPPGAQSTSDVVYPTIKETYPDLCDDTLRCVDVCGNGADQPEWKHAVRRVQQQLKRQEHSRVAAHDEYDTWFYDYPGLYLVPVNDDWIERFWKTVAGPVDESLDGSPPESIHEELPARIWGTTPGDGTQKEKHFAEMSPNDWVLFYRDSSFFAGSVVGRTLEDSAVGEWLWDNPESAYIYTVRGYHDHGPDLERIWTELGYNGDPRVQGFMRVRDDRLEGLRDKHGSLTAALYDPVRGTDDIESGDSTDASDTNTESEINEMEQHSPPTEEATDVQSNGEGDASEIELLSSVQSGEITRSTTVWDRLLRDREAADALKELYGYECQVCGTRLQATDGSGYAEVHHIKPLGDSHGGPDEPGNMLVLCPNHHADFDNGMIAIDTATGQLFHAYDDAITGRRLTTHDSHSVRWDLVIYHNDEIATERGALSGLP